jgi:putative ABC transport system permease protein
VCPLQLVELVAVALLAAFLAALLPMIRLARMQPTSLVKVFANER